MPRYTVDLHNHTPLIPSDYRGDPATTPRQIVERALEVGIDVWGIADHFSVDYGPRLIAAAEDVAAETGRRLLVLPGAELRVRHDGEETHLVCLFPPERANLPFGVVLGALGSALAVVPCSMQAATRPPNIMVLHAFRRSEGGRGRAGRGAQRQDDGVLLRFHIDRYDRRKFAGLHLGRRF